MNKSMIAFGTAVLVSLLAVHGVHGQQATERYIPIGSSPGLSASETLIGTITGVNYAAQSIDVRSRDGTMTVTMNDKTRYFLDRSRRGRTNQTGSIADCKVGRRVELKFTLEGLVDWIKIDPL